MMDNQILERLKHFESHCIETNNPEGAEVIHNAVARIAELESQLEGDKWISVEVEFPEEFKEVLMLREDLSMAVGEIINCETYTRLRFGGCSMPIDDWKIKTTHWQPLPSPLENNHDR